MTRTVKAAFVLLAVGTLLVAMSGIGLIGPHRGQPADPAQWPGPDGPQPHFVQAQGETGNLTGWRELIQIRAGKVAGEITFAWVGGYLGSNRFMQSGVQSPTPDDPRVKAFSWGTFDTSKGAGIVWSYLPYRAGDWLDFHAQRDGADWHFWLIGPDGRRWNQSTVHDASNLAVYIADAETWGIGFGPFTTQAMRHLTVRRGSTWGPPPHLAFGPPNPVCGAAEIVATSGPNLVFRYTGGQPHDGCYVSLT